MYLLIVVVLFGIGVYFLRFPSFFSSPTLSPSLAPTQPVSSQSAELAIVKRVIDGDTVELTDGRRVRYIGVDTPELATPTKGIECFANEAKKKNKELVEGKTITMKKDVSETDRYNRLLRYIWVPSAGSGQGVLVNEYMAREGYARQATFPPDVAYVELFRLSVKEAKNNNKGLWNSCK